MYTDAVSRNISLLEALTYSIQKVVYLDRV